MKLNRKGLLLLVLLLGSGLSALLVVGYVYRVWNSVKYVKADKLSLESLNTTPSPGYDDRPWWRSEYTHPITRAAASSPVPWGAQQSPLWKTPIPGRGHGTPVIWGDAIFVFTANEQEQVHQLLRIDAKSGAVVWTTEVNRGGFMTKHEKNSHASTTPVCDGDRVYINFMAKDAIWVVAVDLNGQQVWKVEAGPYNSHWGYGSSMALHQGLIIVAGDNRGSKLGRLKEMSFLTGLNRRTGDIVWRVPRPQQHSYGTPVLVRHQQENQLLLASHSAIFSYEPLTGNEVWQCRWDAERTANTIAVGDGIAVATFTQPQKETRCVRIDGKGTLTEAQVVWKNNRIATDVPSPLIIGKRLVLIEDSGIINILDMSDGKLICKGRMGSAAVSASPVYFHGLVYASDEKGTTYVFDPEKDTVNIAARNELGEEQFATPVFNSKIVLIRTLNHLWCFPSKTAQGPTS